MVKKVNRNKMRLKRHIRIRKNIAGSSSIPRLSVFRSNKALYIQAIDDVNGVTIASCSSVELKITNNNIDTCSKVGKNIGDKLIKLGIEEAVFDRAGYKYHGKVKAVADGARESGLKF